MRLQSSALDQRQRLLLGSGQNIRFVYGQNLALFHHDLAIDDHGLHIVATAS